MAEGDNNTPEEQKQVTEEKRKQSNLLEDMNKALQKQIDYQARLRRMRGEELSDAQKTAMLYGEQAEVAERLFDFATLRKASFEEFNKTTKEYIDLLDEEVEKGRLLRATAEEEKKIIAEIITLKKEIVESAADENKEADERLNTLIKTLNTERQVTAAREAGTAAGANLVNSLGGLIGLKPNPGLTNLIKTIGTEGAKGGIQGFAAGISSQIGEVFSLGNMIGFLGTRIIELAVAFDTIGASLAAGTGIGKKYLGNVMGLQHEMAALGINIAEVGEAQLALLRDFPRFTELVDENGESNVALQNKMVATAASLSQLGISASETGDNLNFMMTSLGMTGEQAESTFKTMVEQGAAIGIPPDQLSAALKNLQPRLALFGARGPDIMMKTAAAAKSLGVSVGELGGNLFQLSDGLDEFDEAASKVAAFNLVLGGSFVDTFELVTAASEGPFAQVEILQQGLARAGKTLGDMPFRDKQFFAKNFGMEIDSLTAILDGQIKSQEELDKVQKENSMTIEDMAREAIPVLKKFQTAMQNVFGPFVQLLEPVANMLSGIAEALGSAFGPVVIGMIVMGVGKFALGIKVAKEEAKAMATSVANVAKELRLLSLQQQQVDIGNQLDQIQTMTDAYKAQKGPIDDAAKAAHQQALDHKEDLESMQENMAEQTKSITEGLAEQEKGAGKASKAMAGIGMAMEAAGTGMAVYSALVGLLDQLDGGARKIAGAFLLAAGAMGAFAAFKMFAEYGPLVAIPAGIAMGAMAAGIYGMFSGDSKSSTGTPSIGKISESKGFQTTSGVDDAIIQNNGGTTKVTPINKKDQLMAAKPGGPVSEAIGGGGQVPERLIAALETIAARMSAPSNTAGGSPVNVTVELDKRKMGQAVVNIMNKEMALT
jgi:hypothetical protein